MSELFEDLRTPAFAQLYDRYRDQPRIATIPRTNWPTASQFHRNVAPAGYPSIFQFTTPWSKREPHAVLSELQSRCGHHVIRVRVQDYANPQIYADLRQYVEMTLSEYVALVQSSENEAPGYAGNQSLPPEAASQFGVVPPNFYPADSFEPPAYWLGGRGSVTPLHKDSTGNFVFQIVGETRWTLYPVRDVPFLYMSRPDKNPEMDFATSAVDLRTPDFANFPFFHQAHPICTTLQPGEMLYLPAGWAHFVENVTAAFKINYWLSRKFLRTLTVGVS